LKLWQGIFFGVFVGLIASGLILIVSAPPPAHTIEILPSLTPTPFKVYIAGAVNNPGVYEMQTNSRIQDLITAAGGVTEDAFLNSVNLAEKLYDGQKVVIRFSSENSDELLTEEENSSGVININRASLEELMELPGIGQQKAQDIIEYRNQNGQFNTIEEIQNVSGIGPTIFENIKNVITVQ